MTREFILNLDDFVEELTLKIIDDILVLESSLERDDEFKFGELIPYIRGVNTLYSAVLKDSGIKPSKDTDIPLVEIIKLIIDARKSGKIDSKEAWNQIKGLMKRVGEFTKYYGKELKIDLDFLKEKITSKVIYGFEITENFKAPDISKFFMFDNLVDGIDEVYESILDSLDIEEEKIPLLEIIDNIADAYTEDRINPEDAWGQIKDIINEIRST